MLNLNPTDQAEYQRRLAPIEADKQVAIAAGDHAAAKRARQRIGMLADEFRSREPPPPPPTAWEIEMAMTLEQRVDRVEMTLKLGRYADELPDCTK